MTETTKSVTSHDSRFQRYVWGDSKDRRHRNRLKYSNQNNSKRPSSSIDQTPNSLIGPGEILHQVENQEQRGRNVGQGKNDRPLPIVDNPIPPAKPEKVAAPEKTSKNPIKIVKSDEDVHTWPDEPEGTDLFLIRSGYVEDHKWFQSK